MKPIHSPRLIAFYLPQFHPIPENDEWWGKGFTEWTNVARAKPLFRGHYQPHVPADLGFYDLRVPEAREAQADLAREYGIFGFCYYHYWFQGRRILQRPIDEVLGSGTPDFPFCLCWANENWTRTWDGAQHSILLKQEYSQQDHRRHVQHLARFFEDPRYIRVAGKPLFLFYRPGQIPDTASAVAIWRDEAARLGLGDLYLCGVEAVAGDEGSTPLNGFDAAVEFAPDWTCPHKRIRQTGADRWLRRVGLQDRAYDEHIVYSYEFLLQSMLAKKDVPYVRYRCATPWWDNSPRKKKDGLIYVGSTPALFEHWLSELVRLARASASHDDNLVFINAWNEWGEGNHLEPCQRFGRAYLEATRRALFNHAPLPLAR
jgi:lipopolysaccharide biosynthesis protein